jgi:hypothetical protein
MSYIEVIINSWIIILWYIIRNVTYWLKKIVWQLCYLSCMTALLSLYLSCMTALLSSYLFFFNLRRANNSQNMKKQHLQQPINQKIRKLKKQKSVTIQEVQQNQKLHRWLRFIKKHGCVKVTRNSYFLWLIWYLETSVVNKNFVFDFWSSRLLFIFVRSFLSHLTFLSFSNYSRISLCRSLG